MSNQLAIRPVSSMDDIERAATAMTKSGYFQDANQQAQAVVKILAGLEMGFGPFASMNGIHIIKGKPGVGANLQAAAVKGSGKYDYKIREITDKVCRIEFFQGKESIGFSEFTLDDAKKAGTQNLDKFPRNMLFARAMSNGVKWYCPDVFNGSTVYTPEELGATVDGEGEVIQVTGVTVQPEAQPEPEAPKTEKPWTSTVVTMETAKSIKTTASKNDASVLYWNLEPADLSTRYNSMKKYLETHPDLEQEKRDEYQLKIDAADAILKYRQS